MDEDEVPGGKASQRLLRGLSRVSHIPRREGDAKGPLDLSMPGQQPGHEEQGSAGMMQIACSGMHCPGLAASLFGRWKLLLAPFVLAK